jgi:glycosyltransferase involved in cell wall biosynthesis
VRLSVAMCTCNGEAYLGEQLDSIVVQTRPPDELIVCDDSSTDGTATLLESFKRAAPFPVTVLANPSRLGVCRNFEKAITHCSGDIIALSDQDDVWLPAKLSALMEAFDQNPRCGYVFSNADLIDDRGKALGRDLWASIEFDGRQQAQYAAGDQLNVMLRRFTLPYGMTMAFRAAYKPKVMPFECRYSRATAHDTWISLVLTSIGAYGVALPHSLVNYRQHARQLASVGSAPGFEFLVKAKRSTMSQVYLDFADALTHLAEKLRIEQPQCEFVSNARRQLIAKAAHLRCRVRANSSHGLKRFMTVFREALTGRYGLYSRSFKSIVKDLVSD